MKKRTSTLIKSSETSMGRYSRDPLHVIKLCCRTRRPDGNRAPIIHMLCSYSKHSTRSGLEPDRTSNYLGARIHYDKAI